MAEEDTWDQGIYSDQSMSEDDASYMEDSWSEEGVDDYGQEPSREEPEPEPPDVVHCSSSQRRWYEEEEEDAWGEQHHEEDDTREESWTEDDSSQGEYEQPRSCEELNTTQPYNALRTVLSSPYKPSHVPKPKVHSNSSYHSTNELQLFTFSGKRNYLEWERNLDEWLYYNRILKEQRLDYAIGRLKGSAYQWWLQEEEDRWFHKEPTINTWGELKDLLRSKYAPGVSISKIKELYPRCFLNPKGTKSARPECPRGQGKYQVPNKLVKLTSYECKDRMRNAHEFASKTSANSSYKKPVTEAKVKRGAQLDKTEVNMSESFKNIEQLFDKVIHLYKSTKVEKDQTSCCDKQLNQKQEIVSASSTENDQAKFSQLVCKFPMTSIKHLLFSKDVETGTGFSEEQSKQAEPEEKTKPKLSSLELEPPDQGKSSNPLKLPELICYRCQGIGHMAKACPTKRLLSLKSLEHKNVGAKESDIFDKPDLNILNASMIHLSLPKSFDPGIREEDGNKSRDKELQVEQRTAQDSRLIDDCLREAIVLDELKKGSNCIAPAVKEQTVLQPANAFIVSLNISRTISIVLNSDIIHLFLAQSVKDFAGNTKKRIGHEVGRSKNIEEQCQEAITPQACQDTNLKSEAMPKPIPGTLVSETYDLIQYGNNILTRHSFKYSVFNDSTSSIKHLIFVLSVEKKTGTLRECHDWRAHRDEQGGTTNSALLQEEPPDAHTSTRINRQKYFGQGKFLCSSLFEDTNLLYLGAGEIVSRSKPFQEGEYDEDIKSTSTKEHGIRSIEEENMKLRRAKETSELSFAQVEVKIEYPSPTNTWRTFSAHLEDASKWNQPKPIPDEGVIHFSNRVNLNSLDLDQRSSIGGLQPNQRELSYKPTWFRILTQPGITSNWIQSNTGFGLGDIYFLSGRSPNLPYLEAHGFRSLQTHIWRPGEYLLHPEASSITSRNLGESSISLPCTSTHRIRRILIFVNFPLLDAFTLGPITLQRIFPLCCCVLETCSMHLDVPRHHSFAPKLSRLKHHHNLPYLA